MSLHEDIRVRVLTVEYDQIVHLLRTEIILTPEFVAHPVQASFIAIWDTGATNTVISQQVIAALHLVPSGIVEVMTASGARQSYTYSIAMTLANKVHFPSLRATEGNISGGDVLIGMDVISQGDFAITNAHGTTTYSFRVPSLEHIDFGQPH